MPYSMSPSLPVMQMGSVWCRFPQLHILWGFFLLLKHQRWTLRGAVQAAGKTHSSGRSRCGKQDWTIFTGVSSDYDCFSDKIRSRRQLLSCFSISLWKGLECVGGALRLEGTCNLKHSDTTYIFIRAARFWMDLSIMSCSQAIFIIL